VKRSAVLLLALLSGCNGSSGLTVPPPIGGGGSPWMQYGSTAQHAGDSASSPQPLAAIHWRVTLDPNPPSIPGIGGIDAHYGSPVITPGNTVIVPLKTTASGGWGVDAVSGSSGAVLWKYAGDYITPQQGNFRLSQPSYNAVLSSNSRVYFAGSGGKLFYRDGADSAQGTVQTAVFYGAGAYGANKAAFDANVQVNTPLTIDSKGDVFFGFYVSGPNPLNLQSGIARMDAAGHGTWVSASSAAGDPTITNVPTNSAPALSNDESTVYVAAENINAGTGDLLALDATTLKTKGKTALIDPYANQPALVVDDSSASPMVGPDGDVYFGVLESLAIFPLHNDRGWLLHFDSSLARGKIAGSFGWDDTASAVPASMVPSYTGSSRYLIVTKYNNYYGIGSGDGKNRIAILDPNATQPDPVLPSVTVMKEVETILAVTPDPRWPGSFKEWCINSAAVAPAANAVFVNSEDGKLYRWDLPSNSFTQSIMLAPPTAEAYTPTAVGPDGQVYAINDAVLNAVGR